MPRQNFGISFASLQAEERKEKLAAWMRQQLTKNEKKINENEIELVFFELAATHSLFLGLVKSWKRYRVFNAA